MGYQHIPNLYRPEAQQILEFKRVYAMEKIHGTSAHLRWRYSFDSSKPSGLTFFSGGSSHELFKGLFDEPALTAKFLEKFGEAEADVTIFGEAYGGKLQGMSDTYGKFIKFVAFDVQIGHAERGCWLSVPQAAGFAGEFGLDFVDYALVPGTVEALDAERDRPSTQAVRNGIATPQIREGVVLRPPFEVTLNNGHHGSGGRLIAKHKRHEFSERTSAYPGLLDPAKKEALEKVEQIVEEWVTARRLEHVIDHVKARRTESGGDGRDLQIEDTSAVVKEMVEDVEREAAGEIVTSKDLRKAIGAKTVRLFKAELEKRLRA